MTKRGYYPDEAQEVQLKPCPFCGGKAEADKRIPFGYISIHCPKCGAMIAITFNSDDQSDVTAAEEKIVKAWNERTGFCRSRKEKGK